MTPKMIRRSEKNIILLLLPPTKYQSLGVSKNRKENRKTENQTEKPKPKKNRTENRKPNGSVSVMDEKPTENNRTEPKMAVCPKTEPKTILLFYIFYIYIITYI